MKSGRYKYSILIAIAATIVALYSYKFFPDKRYDALADPKGLTYIYGGKLASGASAASWLDEEQAFFRCEFPEGHPIHAYYCSFNKGYDGSKGKGVDLSRYDSIELELEYNGDAPKMRFFARNFNEYYSSTDDSNSTKYNAIYLATRDLNEPISLDVHEFVVTEWWLMAYDIPREHSHADLSNVVGLGVDFSDSVPVGFHDVKMKKIVFVGEWISRENWYLSFLCFWLIGIFVDTVNTLRVMHKEKLIASQVIDSLSEDNESLKSETDKFRKLSTIDSLTETYNRFGIDQIVNTLLVSLGAKEEGAPNFSLILLDIDHFKRVNDGRGHDAGDRVLQSVSAIIKKSIRKGDYLGRWGGEEFVIILPNTRKGFAIALAEKVRIMVNITIFEPENPLVVTVSSGVGSHLPDEDFSETFKRIDEALYSAKNSGRNACFLAKGNIEEGDDEIFMQ